MAGYKYWTERVSARRYIFTGPEFLIPTGLLNQALTVTAGQTMHFKCLWIPASVQADIDTLPWKTPKTLTPILTDSDFVGGVNGAPANINVPGITTWDSNSTWAVERDTLESLLPFPVFDKWGPDDPYMHYLRMKLGIVNVTNMSHYVYHQPHPPSYGPAGWDFNMAPYVALADQHIQSVRTGTKPRVIPGMAD